MESRILISLIERRVVGLGLIASAVGSKVPVSTIAYGTAGGTVVSGGRTFQVPVQPETLV